MVALPYNFLARPVFIIYNVLTLWTKLFMESMFLITLLASRWVGPFQKILFLKPSDIISTLVITVVLELLHELKSSVPGPLTIVHAMKAKSLINKRPPPS